MTEPSAPSKSQSFLDQFHEWNYVTWALEPDTGWFYECVSIFEDADKEIERLRADLVEAVDVLKANAQLWEGWNLLPGSVGGRTRALLARLAPETGERS